MRSAASYLMRIYNLWSGTPNEYFDLDDSYSFMDEEAQSRVGEEEDSPEDY